MTLLAALLPLAQAAPGVQAKLYPQAVDELTAMVEGTTYEVDKADVHAPYDCWDLLGIRNFNLDIPVETIDVALRDGRADLHLDFGEIRGEDMELYAVDSEYTDTCVEFETDILYVSLLHGQLDATVSVDVEGGEVRFDILGTPEVSGDLDTDIDWFPDDLALAFFEEEILDTLAETIAEEAPALLDAYLADTTLGGDLPPWSFALDPADAGIEADGITLGAEVELGWEGDDGCPRSGAFAEGRDRQLELGDGGGSMLAVGLNERALVTSLHDLWEDGYFCFTQANVAEFLDNVGGLFDPSVGGLAATADLDTPPTLELHEDGIAVSLDGFGLRVTGTQDGQEVEVLRVRGDLSATGEIELDQGLGAFTLTLTDLSLHFDEFEASHLVSDDPDAEEHLRGFLEGWVTDWARSQADHVPLYAGLFHAYGWVLKVDRLAFEEGGLTLFLSLYAEDDPAVDDVPPETAAEAGALAEDAVRLAWSGEDDRAGPLAFAWQLDGGSWSSWTVEDGVDLEALEPGTHQIAVKARDAWWNEDPTPVELSFDATALPPAGDDDEPGEGCACGVLGGAPPAGGAAALLGLLAGLRRRRAGAERMGPRPPGRPYPGSAKSSGRRPRRAV